MQMDRQFLKDCALGTKGLGLEVMSPSAQFSPGFLEKSLGSISAFVSLGDNSLPHTAPLEVTMAHEVVQGGWRSTYHWVAWSF